MTNEEWIQFAELIDKIVRAQATWQEKRQEVERAIDDYGSPANFEEFIGWFQDDDVR